jgi:hypothetical protein
MSIRFLIALLACILGGSTAVAQTRDKLVPLPSSPDSCIRSVAVSDWGIVATTCSGRTYLSGIDGLSWDELLPGDMSTLTSSTAYMVFVASGGRVQRRHTEDSVWTSGQRIDPVDTVHPDFIAHGVFGTAIFYVSSRAHGVYRSFDTAETWEPILSPSVAGSVYYIWVSHDDEDSTLIVSADSGVFVTTNGGASWDRFPPPDSSVSIRASFGYRYSVTAIAADGRAFNIEPPSRTWRKVEVPSPYRLLPIVAEHMYDGLLATVQGGIMWGGRRNINGPGITPYRGDLTISSMAHQAFGYLYVGTTNAGLFKNTTFTSGVAEPRLPAVPAFAINSLRTTDGIIVRYSLRKRTDVRIEVYDIGGALRYESTVADRGQGSQEALIPAGSLGTGMYLIRVRAGNESAHGTVVWAE